MCGERDVAIVVLALATGLRLNELRRIQWPDDFDIRRGFVYVRDRAAKTESSVRTVPVDPKAIALVESYVRDHRPSQVAGPLFLNKHGDAFTYYGFSSIFRRLRAHLPAEVDFKIHRGRNTAITNWLRAGTDLYTTMHLAGPAPLGVPVQSNRDRQLALAASGADKHMPAAIDGSRNQVPHTVTSLRGEAHMAPNDLRTVRKVVMALSLRRSRSLMPSPIVLDAAPEATALDGISRRRLFTQALRRPG